MITFLSVRLRLSQKDPIIIMPLCKLCRQISPWSLKRTVFGFGAGSKLEVYNSHHASFKNLQKSAVDCELCSLICKELLRGRSNQRQTFQEDAPVILANVVREASSLEVPPPHLYSIVVQCGKKVAELLAFAEEESPAARSQSVVGRLPLKSGSEESFATISRWLNNCFSEHACCRINHIGQTNLDMSAEDISELPSRVLDVGSDGSTTIKLVEPPAGIKGRYTTLSHRCKSS